MIETAITNLLLADTALTALVADRIFPSRADEKTQSPYVVYSKVSAPRVHCHDGPAGHVDSRFQFSIFAKTYLLTKQIAAAIQDVLQCYTGTSDDTTIYSCLYDNEVDMYDSNTELFHCAVDYMIRYQE